MKITAINTYVIGADQDNWVFVGVDTDCGISGIGECSVEGRELTTVKAVDEIAPYYIGKDPFDTEVHFYKVYRDGYWGGNAVMSGALSAMDIALWDIKGKALDMPVWKLLGGSFKSRIRAYANRWFFGGDTPDRLAGLAEQTVRKGFTALKWDPFAKSEGVISRTQLKRVLQEMYAVRDAVGYEVDLLVEGHGRFNIQTAVEIACEMARYKPMFFEEPIKPENLDALAQVKSKSPVAIAAGERLYSKFDFAQAISKNAVDYLQPDVRWCGGITELRNIGAMAQAALLPVAPHNVHGLVGTAATLQTVAAMPNSVILEYSVEQTALKYGLFETDISFKDGYVEIPDSPGLGILMNVDRVAKMPFARHSMIEKMFE